MFPDGNASVARLLVQKLVPGVAPDMKGPEDVAIARFDYNALDLDDQETRIRLISTVVGVREVEGKQVQVDYVRQNESLRVTADHCILAGYNALIPHLCPEMPEPQKEGLRYGVKTPFVYANVQLENGRAITVNRIPHGYSYPYLALDDPEWRKDKLLTKSAEHSSSVSLSPTPTPRRLH
jgi:spermidine dehydrogenase